VARPRRGVRFRTQVLVGICLLVLVTGIGLTFVALRSFKTVTTGLANSLFSEASNHAVTKTREHVLRAVPLLESLGRLAAQGALSLDDSDRLARQLTCVLLTNPGVSWVSFADAGGAFTGAYRSAAGTPRVNQSHIEHGQTRLIEHDVLPDGTWKLFRQEPDSGYDPRTRPFYVKAQRAGRLVWLPPYVFYEQNVPGITCAKPIYDGAGTLLGVMTIDFDLNALSQFVGTISISPHSHFFLFTPEGELIAHPERRMLVAHGRGGEGKLPLLSSAGDPLALALFQHLSAEDLRPNEGGRRYRQVDLTLGNVRYLGSATAFTIGDDLTWVVGAIAPASDFLGGVRRSEIIMLLLSAAAVLVALLLAGALSRRVSVPVTALAAFMRRVGEGDLDAQAEHLGGSREFRELSAELNRMIGDLRDRLRLRHSLGVAMDVQQRLLPPAPPAVKGLDIAGHSTYCDETGGDYFDFLVLEPADTRTLMVALGDVMGHGVAAALVMAGARAILRSRYATGAGREGELASLAEHLNELLCSDLQGMRFMTMHLSIIDLAGQSFRWVSAGHDPALLYDPQADDFEEVDVAGLPLGVMEDASYVEGIYSPLKPGQVIVVGTDGIWETHSPDGEEFGKQRLREAIRASARGSAQDVVDEILRRVNAFRTHNRPADDVTLVVVKIEPPRRISDQEPEHHIPISEG
jgi:sigma-B regulation protein RsbU (phosphoserine phosphatase)